MSEFTTIQIDNPEAYRARGVDDLVVMRTETLADLPPDMQITTKQKRQLVEESRLLGFDYQVQPDEFLEAHLGLIDGFQDMLNESLNDVFKQKLANGLSDLMKLSGEESEKAKKTWLQRAADTTKVIVQDDLLAPYAAQDGLFPAKERQIVFSGRRLVRELTMHEDRHEAMTVMENDLLAHELLHSFMVGGTMETYDDPLYKVRSGALVIPIENPMDKKTFQYQEHGRWLSEATLEYARRKITGLTRGHYTTGVMALEVAEALDPGVIEQAARVAFLNGNPGVLFGRIEKVFGPHAIEELDLTLARGEYHGFLLFKRELLKHLDPQNQSRAIEVLDTAQEEYSLQATKLNQ